MKKTYEKPRLTALSLSGNDMLCAACPIDVIGSNAQTEIVQMIRDFTGMDVTSSSFASTEACIDGLAIEGYCKFTSAGAESIVFNS